MVDSCPCKSRAPADGEGRRWIPSVRETIIHADRPYDGAGGAAWEAVPGGASDFLDLTDTPGSYAGQGGKLVAVNAGATALEFVTSGGGGGIAPLDGVVIVKHGATAGTARPTAAIAYWLGSVAPTNRQLGDFWLETGVFD
jgi:hypothetical protein